VARPAKILSLEATSDGRSALSSARRWRAQPCPRAAVHV